MELPRDLKHYRPSEDDFFQLISPDLAIVLLIAGGFIGFVFRGFL